MTAKALVQFNKKKYHAIRQALQTECEMQNEDVQAVMDVIQRCLNFDPNVQTYSPEQVQKITQAHKDRAKRNGVTQYQMMGKTYYENNKELFKERIRTCKQNSKLKDQGIVL